MNAYKSKVYKSKQGEQLLIELYKKHLKTITVPYTEMMVETRFGKTHIVIYGNPNGKPVLGFHGGNSTNPYSLRAFIKHVDMQRIMFIVPDTIGNIGLSADTRLSSSNDDYGEWACDILDALELKTIAVFGGSYGGGIALRLAAYAPERIERLILFVPSGIKNAGLFSMAKIGLPTIGYMLRPSSDEKLKKAISSMMPSANGDFLEMTKLAVLNTKFEMAMPRNATIKEMQRLNAPVYVIAEKYDCLFPGEAVLKRAEKLFVNLAGTHLLTFGGHGAFLVDEETHFEHYDMITDYLLQ